MKESCCSNTADSTEKSYEVVKIEKAKSFCSGCEDFAEGQLKNKIPYSILSCEGACLRGEVSRLVANNICFNEIPEKTSRICLGGAFTKNTGQRNLVRNAERVIALEGCSIQCASRMMKGVIDDLETEVILVDKYYDFDTNLFAINEVSEQEMKQYAKQATEKIIEKINTESKSDSGTCC
ncbi:MAG: hypothetical protein C0597_00630 [Marinilabiliales bacterium]|nr:MAG: hypothetical protein C0597_00630 [Marinilabiliales bacterium]